MLSTQKHAAPLGNYDVPIGWPMKPYKRPYGGTPGPPVMYEKPSDPEDEGAGYMYCAGNPMRFVDVDGNIIRVANQQSFNLILKGLPANVRENIILNKNNTIIIWSPLHIYFWRRPKA